MRKLTANDWLARAAQVTQIAARTMARQDHIIICGYGRSGQNLARLLEAEEIPYVAMDSDPERVREAAADGSSVVYGDASRREALGSAGLAKARAVAITFANTPIALKILHNVHQQRPELPVIVRTRRRQRDRHAATTAGATEVVPEVLEGSLMLASHSLLLLGVPLNRVLARIRAIREERYGLFRGFFHGATDAADAADNLQARLHTVRASRPRRRRRPHARGARARRRSSRSPACAAAARRSQRPTPEWRFEAGDVVVLLGRPEALCWSPRRSCSRASRASAATPLDLTDRGSLRRPERSGYNRPPFRLASAPLGRSLHAAPPAAPADRCDQRHRDGRRVRSATTAGGPCSRASTWSFRAARWSRSWAAPDAARRRSCA